MTLPNAPATPSSRTPDEYGARLRAAREALALTQAEAAERAGISARAWGGYERGEKTPKPRTARDIAAAVLEPAGYAAGESSAGSLGTSAHIPPARETPEAEPAPVGVPLGEPVVEFVGPSGVILRLCLHMERVQPPLRVGVTPRPAEDTPDLI